MRNYRISSPKFWSTSAISACNLSGVIRGIVLSYVLCNLENENAV